MFYLFFIIAFLSYFFFGVGYSGDHLSFLFEREFYNSYFDYFVHILSFDRTRHTIAPNSLLFRPGFTFFLVIEDLFFRAWPAMQVLIRILLQSLNTFILFKILESLKLNKKTAFFLASLFLIRFPSCKLINEIHFGPYLFVTFFCGLAILYRSPIYLLMAAFFHESVAIALILLCIFRFNKKTLVITTCYLFLNLLSFLLNPIEVTFPTDRSYFNMFNSGIVHTFYLLGRFLVTFFIPQLFNIRTSLGYIFYIPAGFGLLYLFYRHRKNKSEILFFSFIFLVSLAGIIGFGRGGLGSLSYLQSAYWNEYFAGFFIFLILGVLYQKYLNSIPTAVWALLILFNLYSSFLYIEKIKSIPIGTVEKITWELKKNKKCFKAPQEFNIEARLPSILWKDYFCVKNAQNIFILNEDISSIPTIPNGDDFIRQNNLYRFFNSL